MAKTKFKFDKVSKGERKVYNETIILVILVLLTIISLLISMSGFAIPGNVSAAFLTSLLTNLLLVFLIAETVVVILILNRIYQK